MSKVRSQKSKVKATIQNSKFLLLTFGFTFLLFTFTLDCYAQDKIIAVVNNEIITQGDLNDFLNFIRMQLSQQYKGEALKKQIEALKPDLLNKLIDDRLILQEARKENIKINEERVRERIREIKARYPSEAEFQSDLSRDGLVQADIENKIREQMLMYLIIEEKVRSKVTVRPDEVTVFYNGNIKEFFSPEERDLDVITLENEDLAKSLVYNLKSGQKLVDLATRYPIVFNKLVAREGQDLRKDIEEVVFKLNIGEVSNPVRIEDQYYVFKLNTIIPPRQLTLSEAQDRIHAFLLEKKSQEQLQKWLDEIKKKSYIKIAQN